MSCSTVPIINAVRLTGITAQGENTLGEGAWVTSRVLVAVDGAALTAGALYAYGPGRAAAPLVAVGEFQQLPLWLPLNAQRQLHGRTYQLLKFDGMQTAMQKR